MIYYSPYLGTTSRPPGIIVMKVGERCLMFQKQLTLDQRVEFDSVLEGGWKGKLYIHL